MFSLRYEIYAIPHIVVHSIWWVYTLGWRLLVKLWLHRDHLNTLKKSFTLINSNILVKCLNS